MIQTSDRELNRASQDIAGLIDLGIHLARRAALDYTQGRPERANANVAEAEQLCWEAHGRMQMANAPDGDQNSMRMPLESLRIMLTELEQLARSRMTVIALAAPFTPLP